MSVRVYREMCWRW